MGCTVFFTEAARSMSIYFPFFFYGHYLSFPVLTLLDCTRIIDYLIFNFTLLLQVVGCAKLERCNAASCIVLQTWGISVTMGL